MDFFLPGVANAVGRHCFLTGMRAAVAALTGSRTPVFFGRVRHAWRPSCGMHWPA